MWCKKCNGFGDYTLINELDQVEFYNCDCVNGLERRYAPVKSTDNSYAMKKAIEAFERGLNANTRSYAEQK